MSVNNSKIDCDMTKMCITVEEKGGRDRCLQPKTWSNTKGTPGNVNKNKYINKKNKYINGTNQQI